MAKTVTGTTTIAMLRAWLASRFHPTNIEGGARGQAWFAKVGMEPFHLPLPRIECADGFSFSVQAGRHLYSTPREDLKDGAYTHVEVGFPSGKSRRLAAHGGGPDVWGYVPIKLVLTVINEHGGAVNVPDTGGDGDAIALLRFEDRKIAALLRFEERKAAALREAARHSGQAGSDPTL